MIKLKINDLTVEAPPGSTVLQAAEAAGFKIPTLCYHKDLSPFGGCRLCVVEVQGARLPMTSCNLPVSPGLVVHTESPSLTRFRRAVLRMLLLNFYDAAYKVYNGGFDVDQDSELAYWAKFYEVDIRANMARKPRYPVDSDPNPFVWVDMNKCIQCTRCVRACAEIQGRFVWAQAYRGYQARIVAGADTTMLQARCESCGACVVYCPTGALDNKMSVSAGRADRLVRTTCAYCSVGCQLDLNVKDDVPGGRVIRVTSNFDEWVKSFNRLHLCVKGRYGYEFIHAADRLKEPRVRQYLLDGSPRPKGRGKWAAVDWDTALEIAAAGLAKARQEHGSQSVAVISSGKHLLEENYLLNKLARQVLGTNNIDCAAHLYSANVTGGLMETLGLPAMPTTFEAIADHASSLLVIGSNLTEQHPVLGARIRQAILRRKVKLVVASPDFINIAEYAALPLYHHPGTESALLNGLMHIIVQQGRHDPSSAARDPDGFAALKARIEPFTPEHTAEITGVSVEALRQAAEILAHNRPMAVLWSAGLADAERGCENVHSIANLQLLLGNLDIRGGGVAPLQSQNNLQGACDMGNLPDYLPGYRPTTDRYARQIFEHAWGVALPENSGLDARAILLGNSHPPIRALYIVAEDLLNTSRQARIARQRLEECDFIVLQEVSSGETDRYADVLLPGVTFAEKTGVYTSAERRIQMVQQAIEPLGQARPDWQIITDLAQRLIQTRGDQIEIAPYSAWNYADTSQVMEEIAALTPIYAGITHARLKTGVHLHWPTQPDQPHGMHEIPSGMFSAGKVHFR